MDRRTPTEIDLNKIGLYLHFPFCRRRCFYCHFFKVAYEPNFVGRYIRALVREIELRKNLRMEVETVYFGGGSPSLMKTDELGKILDALHRSFTFGNAPEITLEANPEDLSRAKLRFYLRSGINRISIGVQSFCDSDLVYLKRNHTAADSEKSVGWTLDSGFENINVDLMIGLPGQTPSRIDQNVSIIQRLSVPHVSVYMLEGVSRGKTQTDGSRDHCLFHHVRRRLGESGYRQYEVSNYARKGFRCRHNLTYWKDKPYIGVGASASGYGEGIDYRNLPGLGKYVSRLEKGRLPAAQERRIDPGIRRIITGLRLIGGIPASAFAPFADPMQFLLENGMLMRRGGNIAVPPEKILVLNEILGYFVPG